MGLIHSPASIVTDGLALHLDAANPNRYQSGENYISYSNYDPRTWNNIIPQNATLVTGIDAPDGSNTAIRFICNDQGGGIPSTGYRASLLRITIPDFVANGVDTYTASFYARLISGSSASSLTCDLQDGNPTTTYTGSLIRNQWVRITATGIPSAGTKNFFDIFSDSINNYTVDLWGAQLERGSTATTLTPTNGSIVLRTWFDTYNQNNVFLSNVTYVGGSIPYFDFNGTSSYGYNFSAFNNPLTTGNTASVLLWIYPNTTQPDPSYSGMFALGTKGCALGNGNGQTLLFSMQSNRTLTMAKWCDDSFSSIAPTANTWSMVSLVKDGASTRFGINGSTFSNGGNTGTQNFAGTNLTIGCTDNPGRYYSGRIASVMLYKTALSDSQILQNFNAQRRRFGL